MYPYIIGAFKGIPEISNFQWATSNGAISDTSIEKKKFTFNFRSLKSEDVSVNNQSEKSISITQDSNNINMLVNSQDYRWNFTQEQLNTTHFGRDSYTFGNKISDLKSTSSDTFFKAYGKVSKWIASGTISKGTCVRIINKEISGENYLCVETYNTVGILEQQVKAAVLGIALNDATDTNTVYVCTEGMTTIIINNSISIQCGSYGILSSASESTGRIIGLGDNTGILADIPVLGYFLETKTTTIGDYILFKIKTNYEFN